MLLFAIQIYQIFGLLTFSKVLFYSDDDNLNVALEIELVDENLKLVQTQKTLIVESNPLSYVLFYPPLIFKGNLTSNLLFLYAETYFLTISCDGCEIITTNSLFANHSSEIPFDITPISTSIPTYEELEIQYNFLVDFTGLTTSIYVFLINKEIFYYDISTYAKTFTITFFRSGEKHLVFYFDDGIITYTGGLSINVPVISYNSLEFLETFVNFI